MGREYQLEALEETREEASKYLKHRQALTKKTHNKKLKKIYLLAGDLVLMYDSRFAHFPGKLHTRWLGPYIVHAFYGNGSVELSTLMGELFPVRVHYNRLKKYYHQE